jgi:hypothetical protein
MLAKGRSRRSIVAYFDALGVPTRTADRYIARARDQWRETQAERAPTVREARLHDLERISRKLERAEAWAPLATFKRIIVDVEGSKAPEQHEIKAAVGVVQVDDPFAQLDFTGADESELAGVTSFSAKLAAKRGRALPEHVVGDAQLVEK